MLIPCIMYTVFVISILLLISISAKKDRLVLKVAPPAKLLILILFLMLLVFVMLIPLLIPIFARKDLIVEAPLGKILQLMLLF